MTDEIDELKLTAYALGELDGPACAAERAELEAHLAADEAARRHVEEVRATARVVRAELSAELSALSAGPMAGLAALQHAAIERRLEGAGLADGGAAAGHYPLRPVRRNWAMWGSLAASVVIVCSVMAGVLPMIYHPAHPLGTGRQPGTTPGDGDPSAGSGPIVIDPNSPGLHEVPGGLEQSPGLYTTPEVPAFPEPAPPLVNGERGFVRVSEYPLSTVPIGSSWPDDAERGGFPSVRRGLAGGHLPPVELVRTDEIVNAFPYHYAAPAPGEPVAASIEVATCPWSPSHRLMRLGLRTAEAGPATEPAGATTTRPASAEPATMPEGRGSPDRGLAGLSVQVEFSPRAAGAYRLLGYEDGSFGSDMRYETEGPRAAAVGGGRSAGSLTVGRTITALYEIVPASEVSDGGPAVPAPALKYQKLTPLAPAAEGAEGRRELLTVSVRFRETSAGAGGVGNAGVDSAWRLLEFPIVDDGRAFADASEDFRMAAATAAFALVLRNSPYKGTASYDLVIEMVSQGQGADPTDGRAVLLEMARRAKSLGGAGTAGGKG